MVIHKNKSEVFKCNLKVDGADIDDTVVRLCLEFEDNKNMFFYGKLNNDGTCSITIPKLQEIDSKEGKLTIEAIADSVYFKLYETEVDLRNSIEVEFVKPEIVKEANIELQNVTRMDSKPQEIKPKPDLKPKFESKLPQIKRKFQDYVVDRE